MHKKELSMNESNTNQTENRLFPERFSLTPSCGNEHLYCGRGTMEL